MALTSESELTGNGMNQGDIYVLMSNIVDLVNEIQTDHATMILALDGILAKLDADAGITDTDYAAVHGTAGSGAAIPATLTNITALTLG